MRQCIAREITVSIRKLSMLFSGGVAALVILASVLAILTEVQRLNTSIKVGDATKVISFLNKATVELSFERSLSQVGLALPSAFPKRFNDMLIEQRNKSDKLFDAVGSVPGRGVGGRARSPRRSAARGRG
jgi:hypothetical protein